MAGSLLRRPCAWGRPGGWAPHRHNEMWRYRRWETPYALTQALTATLWELLLPQAAHSCGPGGTPAYLATLCYAVLYGRGPFPHSLAAAPVYLSAVPTAAWTTWQAAQPLQHQHGLPARADCATCLRPDRHLPPSPHMRDTPPVWCTPNLSACDVVPHSGPSALSTAGLGPKAWCSCLHWPRPQRTQAPQRNCTRGG